jgi:hypothetical protein
LFDLAADVGRFPASGPLASASHPASLQQIRMAQSSPSREPTSKQARQSSLTRASPQGPVLASAAVETPGGVPILDAEASCRVGETLGVGQTTGSCLSLENSARDQLVRKWAQFPNADRSHCLRVSTASGGGTYTDLLTCLEMETTLKNLHSKPNSLAQDQLDTPTGRATSVTPNVAAH